MILTGLTPQELLRICEPATELEKRLFEIASERVDQEDEIEELEIEVDDLRGVVIDWENKRDHLIAREAHIEGLVESLTELHSFVLSERDAFYDCCSNEDGVVQLASDVTELARIDALIDKARAAIDALQTEGDRNG